MEVEKKYYCYTAHRNETAGEKCGRIHGHTYDIKCYFTFSNLDKNGVTCLFSDIDDLVEPIIKSYDHYLILWEEDKLCNFLDMANEKYIKLPFITSAENFAIWIYHRIKRETNLPITKIQLAETKSSNVIYYEK